MGYRGRLIDGRLMSCQFTQEFMSRYLDNRLGQPERSNVILHLAACGECRIFAEELHEATKRDGGDFPAGAMAVVEPDEFRPETERER